MANARIVLMVISLALSVVIGLVLGRGSKEDGASTTATSGSETANGAVLIGLSLDTLKEARWQADRDLFVAKAKELGA